MFLEVEKGEQDQDEEAVKVYLIRFIADLPHLSIKCIGGPDLSEWKPDLFADLHDRQWNAS